LNASQHWTARHQHGENADPTIICGGAARLENALYFLEQIKNPHMFRVGDDVVELGFSGEESLSDVLAKHFNRKKYISVL
jgi:hypothetical protein